MPPPQPPFSSFNTTNFYAGSQLNRLSWMRTESDFLNAALTSPETRFIVLQNLNPLTHKEGDRDGYLATLSWRDVEEYVVGQAKLSGHTGEKNSDGHYELFGPHVHGLQPTSSGDNGSDEHIKALEKTTTGVGSTSLALVFLGVDESGQSQSSLPGQLAKSADPNSNSGVPAGVPYYALSLTYQPKHLAAASQSETTPLKTLERKLLDSGKYDFVDTRALGRAGDWPMHDAALVAQARALVDWNERHHFCPACSRRQYSLWGGYKRSCASALTRSPVVKPSPFTQSLVASSANDDGLGECPSTTTLSNFCYPRTDPVVIMGVLSPDGERLLLGRQKKWPPNFWSCLAGFIEPGESLEEAVRREVKEEAGVPVSSVVYHSSQPWPFPNQLMQGCFGIAQHDPTTEDGLPPLRLDLDNELEAAHWYTREEVLAVLDASKNNHFSKSDLKRLEDAQNKAGHGPDAKGSAPQQQQKDQGSIANTDSNHSGERPAQALKFKVSSGRCGVQSADSLLIPSLSPFGPQIPPATAIAHVLIAAWARKEAILPLPEVEGKNGAGRAKV